jgi:hypothetical protein
MDKGPHRKESMVVILKYCFYCGIETTTARGPKSKPLPDNYRTKDHMLPKSRGGDGLRHNTVLCCDKCNREKGCLTFDEYRAVWAFRNKMIVLPDVKIFAGDPHE